MIALLLLAACAGPSKDDTAGDTAAPLDPTLTNVQAEIFTPSCAFSTCHGNGASMDLTEGNAHAAIVDVDSRDNPGHTLIVPGDAAGSYLVRKCTPGATDLLGGLMPDGSDGLDATRLALLEAWVNAGAPND